MNTQITGKITLGVSGNEAFIIRKNGTKINIPESKQVKEKVEDGDTLSAGKNTIIVLNISLNLGKDKPVYDPQHNSSKSITLFPGAELKLSGLEEWNREDKTSGTTYSGETIKNWEVTKGMFSCSYFNCEDPLMTPVPGF